TVGNVAPSSHDDFPGPGVDVMLLKNGCQARDLRINFIQYRWRRYQTTFPLGIIKPKFIALIECLAFVALAKPINLIENAAVVGGVQSIGFNSVAELSEVVNAFSQLRNVGNAPKQGFFGVSP